MLTINCTAKLRKEIDFEIEESLELKRDDFYNWHGHLFTINRRKTIVLMNVKTRYSIVLYGLKKADFKNFNKLVLDAIRDNFKAEGIKDFYIEKYLENMGKISYTKTYNRSIISSINYLKSYIEHYNEELLDISSKDMLNFNKRNNRIPISKLGWNYAIDALRNEFIEQMGRTYNQVYRFKISLEGIEPTIWRRVEVPEDYTFWDLHVAIQDAMGWLDYHLHEFRVKGREIGIPHQDFATNIRAGWEEKIVDYFTKKKKKVNYIYDFGDYWEHIIEFEGVYPLAEEIDYPRCLAGERSCPPEDCGGIPGYENLLEILKNPEDDQYEHILKWLGGKYELEGFDASEVKFDNPQERLSNILYKL